MLPASVSEIAVTPMGFAVIVKPEYKEKIIPIFIGPSEAFAISSILQNEKTERPVGADLLRSVIEASGASVNKIFINDFHGGMFFARVYITGKHFEGGLLELDARPSDAIALAVRFSSPIFVAEHVYNRTAISHRTLRDADRDALSTGELDVDDILTADEREEFFEAILEEFGEKKKAPTESKDKTLEKVKFYSRTEVLQQMLNAALTKEDYEEAARLRDELRTEINN